jgi:hypothetical protein
LTDEEIAARVAIAVKHALKSVADPVHRSIAASDLLDAAEAYRMAYAKNADEWMEMRRGQFEIRKLAFKKLGLHDYSCVEK